MEVNNKSIINGCNGLMCVEVMKLVVRRSLVCTYIRLAGSIGVDVFEEVYSQGGYVPICAEVRVPKKVFPSSPSSSYEGVEDGGDCAIQHLPLRATSSQNAKKKTTPDDCRVIACSRAMERLGVTWRFTTFGGHIVYKLANTSNNTTSYNKNKNMMMAEIDSLFLAHCPNLKGLVLEGVESVGTIGYGFLMGSRSLTTISLEPFHNVTSVGYSFMGQTGVRSIDLSPLRNVTCIGSGFMAGSTNLTHIDLAPLSQLERIESKFLSICLSLKSISNMSALVKVSYVGVEFLDGCRNLEAVDLSFMRNVPEEEVQRMFLANCSSLRTVDLSPLSHITYFKAGFLKNCWGLRHIDFSPLQGTIAIGDDFMMNCSNIDFVDCSPMTNLNQLGSSFLAGCTSLQQLTLPRLIGNGNVSNHFLESCHSLEALDLSPFVNVKYIGKYFMANCSQLRALDLRPLVSIESWVGASFGGCSRLEENIDMSPVVHAAESYAARLKALQVQQRLGTIHTNN